MIIFVFEQFHDYSPQKYFIDFNKLDKNNPVDQAIFYRMKDSKPFDNSLYFNCKTLAWECPSISRNCKIQNQQKADKFLHIVFNFDS